MRRHRFEPAPLLTGLLLAGAGLAYLLDAVGVVRLHPGALALLVPAALLAGAVTGLLTYGVRRTLTRRREASAGGHGSTSARSPG